MTSAFLLGLLVGSNLLWAWRAAVLAGKMDVYRTLAGFLYSDARDQGVGFTWGREEQVRTHLPEAARPNVAG